MPIPSYPENRREEYLNNIATGSGEIPPYPENREEQYLDAIARNGGGGGGGGVLVVHGDGDTGVLDKTWQEIADADFAVMKGGGGGFTLIAPLVSTEAVENEYYVTFADISVGGTITYYNGLATSASGYPVLQQGD